MRHCTASGGCRVKYRRSRGFGPLAKVNSLETAGLLVFSSSFQSCVADTDESLGKANLLYI